MMSEEQLNKLRALEEDALALERLAMALLTRADALHESVLDLLNKELAGPLV